MKKIRVYDIDGTITKPGNDLWYAVTRKLVSDTTLFENEINKWKKNMVSGNCPYKESKRMMQKGVSLIYNNISNEEIEEETKK